MNRVKNVLIHYMAICEKTEETKLCNTAESNLLHSKALKPLLGYQMVNMLVRGQRDPDVDIS
jgi:hypothetical protein